MLKDLIKKVNCNLTIEVNNHKTYYQTAEDYLQDEYHKDFLSEIDKEVYEKMIEKDSIIEIQIYPNTPISFFKIYHFDIDEAIDQAINELC